MLCTNGKTNGILPYALIGKLCLGQLAMRGGCWVNDKALDVCNVCKKRKDLEAINKLVCLTLTALDLKGEDRSTTVREILFIECVIGMISKRRMIDLFYLRMICEEFHHLFCVFCMAFKTKR